MSGRAVIRSEAAQIKRDLPSATMDIEANGCAHQHDHHHSHGHHDDENASCIGDGDVRSNVGLVAESIHDEDKIQRQNVLRRLKIASMLCFTFFLVEVTGGFLAGSLAILSDAAHLFSDLAAFVVAIAASHLASLPPSSAFTFGFKRTEALAALFSMASLAIVSIFLLVEGIRRLYPFVISWVSGETSGIDHNQDVDGKLMSLVALIGVAVNVTLAFVLGEHHVHLPGGDHGHSHEHNQHGHCEGGHHSHEHEHGHSEKRNLITSPKTPERSFSSASGGYGATPSSVEVLHADELPPPHHDHSHSHLHQHHDGREKTKRNVNLHAAYLHVLADLAQSLAVLIAGLVIWWRPTWRVIDPICTILFCIVVFYSTIGVIRSSISVLLEEVPPHVDWDLLYESISSVPGVTNVHDLHVWSISHGFVALSVHANASNPDEALQKIHDVCSKHGVGHSTIQLQSSAAGNDCITCGPGMLHCM